MQSRTLNDVDRRTPEVSKPLSNLCEQPQGMPLDLFEEEARERLRQDGYNELPQHRRRTLAGTILEVMREPMFQLLIAAGLIYTTLGDHGEALMLLGFVTITVTISIVEERRTERVLEALRDLTSPRALVIRGGKRRRIAGREVVRGDVLFLVEGDRVPADAELLEANDFVTDESLLTGESVPVRKRAGSHSPAPARPGGDDLPFVFSGTVVVRGQGVARVTATGTRSEIGRIGKALEAIELQPTLLQAQTRRLVQLFAALGATLSVIVVLLYGLIRGSWLNGILAGITLAMAMLPEEFPLILTVFMVIGAWRLSKEHVLTRRTACIETLGAATVLCTDKTGTLTQNRMSIAEMQASGAQWSASAGQLPEAFHELLEYGILASERDPFDPIDKAFQALGERFLAGTEHIHQKWILAHEYGLSSEMLAMSHVWKPFDRDYYVIAAKGAPEAIADLCHMSTDSLQALRRAVQSMAARGMRVIGVARAFFEDDEFPPGQHDFDFQFMGMIGLADPLRASVPAAMAECRSAGIKVVVITGDYPATASAIAQAAGIDDGGAIITGDELQSIGGGELARMIEGVSIFARIMPEQKMRIVDALKANGEVVAMTGDGVNDAPSLKSADIGIAMGERGTDVAREAASLVLLDDDFSSIVKAVRLGRRIFDNLRKAMGFIVAVHIPIAGLSLMPLLFRLPLLFTPVHIAFLELIIDPVCSIVFEAEPEEEDLMRRKPRDRKAPLFSASLMAWSIFQGACVLLAVGAFFIGLLRLGFDEAQARAAAYLALISSNFALILVNRSFGGSIATSFRQPNPALMRIFVATAVLLAAVLGVADLRTLFHFALPPAGIVLIASSMGLVLLIMLDGIKAALRGSVPGCG
jgi:Ca2+-transporting ATPase